MTQDELNMHFFYHDGQVFRNRDTKVNRKGTVIGCRNSHGYVRMYWKGRLIFAHKAIWIMHNGDIPKGMQIDHINGIRSDNRIENLRTTTHNENHKNKKKPSTNTSGVAGVDFKKERNRWRASIHHEGAYIFLGYFKLKTEAIHARMAAEKAYGYHANHGR
jgi:hypothetical protein